MNSPNLSTDFLLKFLRGGNVNGIKPLRLQVLSSKAVLPERLMSHSVKLSDGVYQTSSAIIPSKFLPIPKFAVVEITDYDVHISKDGYRILLIKDLRVLESQIAPIKIGRPSTIEIDGSVSPEEVYANKQLGCVGSLLQVWAQKEELVISTEVLYSNLTSKFIAVVKVKTYEAVAIGPSDVDALKLASDILYGCIMMEQLFNRIIEEAANKLNDSFIREFPNLRSTVYQPNFYADLLKEMSKKHTSPSGLLHEWSQKAGFRKPRLFRKPNPMEYVALEKTFYSNKKFKHTREIKNDMASLALLWLRKSGLQLLQDGQLVPPFRTKAMKSQQSRFSNPSASTSTLSTTAGSTFPWSASVCANEAKCLSSEAVTDVSNCSITSTNSEWTSIEIEPKRSFKQDSKNSRKKQKTSSDQAEQLENFWIKEEPELDATQNGTLIKEEVDQEVYGEKPVVKKEADQEFLTEDPMIKVDPDGETDDDCVFQLEHDVTEEFAHLRKYYEEPSVEEIDSCPEIKEEEKDDDDTSNI